MEIVNKKIERNTRLTALFILGIIGLSLAVSTWQTMVRQNKAEEEHLLLTSRSIFQVAENALRRGPVKEGAKSLAPRAKELLLDLGKDGGILFAAVTDPGFPHLLCDQEKTEIVLPPSILEALFKDGEWHGNITLNGTTAYIYGKKMLPPKSRHMSLDRDTAPPLFLLIGIDVEHHLGAYRGVRQNALLQAGYILIAALCMWGLAVSWLARKERAQKADALERFQALLLDHLPDGLLTLTTRGHEVIIQSANPAALNILQQQGESLLGKTIRHFPESITACVLDRERFHCPDCWQHVDIGPLHLEVLTLPLADGGKNSFMMILRDRTQLRRLENSLAEAEKLATIGTLAAGVAHEVRNPLSALRGFAQYFVKKLQGKQPEEEYAKTMVREADRLNRVITDLLYLAKPKPPHKETIFLQRIADEVFPLLRFDLEQRKAEIHYELHAETLFADPDAVKQILLNLLLNSLESLDGINEAGDSHTNEKQDARRHIVIRSGTGEGHVWVTVEDKGCGMTKEQTSHVFEPFFTLKEHGTGLGLALAHRLMHEQGGTIEVFSRQGEGTIFRLEFPAKAEGPAPSTQETVHRAISL